MPDIIQQLLDLKEWSQNPERYERRLNFRGAGLVQPGPGRQGYATRYKPRQKITKKTIAELEKNLPEGLRIRKLKRPDGSLYYQYQASASIKGERWAESRSISEENLEYLIQARKEKIAMPQNALSEGDFKKLRLKHKNLGDAAFADLLDDLDYVTSRRSGHSGGSKFTKHIVAAAQKRLDITEQVGRGLDVEYRTLNEVKDVIRDSRGGKDFLQKYGNKEFIQKHGEKKLRLKAARIVFEELNPPVGSFGDTQEAKLFTNLWKASQKGTRIELVGKYADKKNWPDNWTVKDKNGNQFWKGLKFKDTEAKGKPIFEWNVEKNKDGTYKYKHGNLRVQVDEAFQPGFFERSTKAYVTQRIDMDRVITYKGEEKTIGGILREEGLLKQLRTDLGRDPNQKEIAEWFKTQKRGYTYEEVHHTEGVAKNPYKTEPALRYANRKLNDLDATYKAAVRAAKNPQEIRALKSKFIKDIEDLPGGIRYLVDKTMVGKKGTPQSIATEALKATDLKKTNPYLYKKIQNNIVKNLDDAEIPCIKGVGGNCTTPEDFKKGFNQVVERAAAGDKVAGTKINKFLKGMRKFKGPLKWTGWGLLGEAAFVIPFGVMDYAAGKSWKRILGNATDWGFGPMLGQSEQEEFIAALPEGSKALEAQNIVDIGEQIDRFGTRSRGPMVGMDRGRYEHAQRDAYNKLIDEYNLNYQPFVVQDTGDVPVFSESLYGRAHQEAEETRARIAAQEAQRIQEREEKGILAQQNWMQNVSYAGGGIASLLKKK